MHRVTSRAGWSADWVPSGARRGGGADGLRARLPTSWVDVVSVVGVVVAKRVGSSQASKSRSNESVTHLVCLENFGVIVGWSCRMN
jgi:hypothetical protein